MITTQKVKETVVTVKGPDGKKTLFFSGEDLERLKAIIGGNGGDPSVAKVRRGRKPKAQAEPDKVAA